MLTVLNPAVFVISLFGTPPTLGLPVAGLLDALGTSGNQVRDQGKMSHDLFPFLSLFYTFVK